MSFCTFSTDLVKENTLRIDNAFIEGFLPNANADAVKVYLWGLYKCNNPQAVDNTLDGFSHALNLSPEDIISSFYYWQDLGLVQVLNIDKFQIKYLPVSSASAHLKKYNKDKYKKFNMTMQDLYGNRMISTNEFNELYYTMDSMHIDEDAMLVIANYCLAKKTNSVSINYIIATAKNWAYGGVHTLEDARERIATQERTSSDVKLVLSALGIKRAATDEEFNNYLSWTRDLSIPVENLVHIAKHIGKGTGAWNKLCSYVDKCYSLRLNSIKEIDDYIDSEQAMYDIAKNVCKNLGVRYERLDTIVDTYIAGWLALGFDANTLSVIANHCFTTSVRTLQGMNGVINKLFKNGLITTEAIDNYLSQITKDDAKITDILSSLGLVRAVTANDRVLLKTWVYDWNISDELINYACTKCVGAYMPLMALNKLLATYHNQDVKTIKQAEKIVVPTDKASTNKKPKAKQYSSSELNSLFSNNTEVQL